MPYSPTYQVYEEALSLALGSRILLGEITQGEAERMFFPFYDQDDGLHILNAPGRNSFAHTLLYGAEKCVYKVIKENNFNKWLSLDFKGVEIGELTEVGIWLNESAFSRGQLRLRAEPTDEGTSGFFDGGFSLQTDEIGISSVKTLKLFGNKVFARFIPTEVIVGFCAVVYAKYKPCGLGFDFTVTQPGNDYQYVMPCVSAGYKLKAFTLCPGKQNNAFHLYKRSGNGDSANIYLWNDTGAERYKLGAYHYTPTGTSDNLKTNYRDCYFGSDGERDGTKEFIPYRLRLEFEKADA